jgi:hypothetical protein
MISAILVAGMLLADSTAALQAAPDATATPAKPAATAQTVSQATGVAAKQRDPEALVCKSEPVLGSRLPIKRCRTQGDMAQQKIQDRQALERSQIMTDNGH